MVDIVVNVVESEKCALDMSSYEDLHSSVGANVGSDGKEDYVFVDGSDVASFDDHTRNRENVEVNVAELSVKEGDSDNVNGDVETDRDVALFDDHTRNRENVEVNVAELSVKEGDRDNLNGDVETDRDIALFDDHTRNRENVEVNVAELSVKEGDSDKVENEVDEGEENGGGVEGGGLVEENREIKTGSEMVEVENGDSDSNDSIRVSMVKESSDREPNVDEIKEGSVSENVVDEVEESSNPKPVVDEVKEAELDFETVDSGNASVDGIGSRSSDADDYSKGSVSDVHGSSMVETEDITSVNSIPNAAESSEIKEVVLGFQNSDNGNASVFGVGSHSSDVEDNNKDRVSDVLESAAVETEDIPSVNSVSDFSEPSEVKEVELGFEISNNGIGSLSSGVDDNNKDGVSDTQEFAEAGTEEITPVNSVPDAPESSEIKGTESGFDTRNNGNASVDGIGSRSSDVDDDNKDSVSDTQESGEVATEDIAAVSSVPDAPEHSEIKEAELGYENTVNGNVSVDGIGSRSSDFDNNNKDSVTDAQESAEVAIVDITTVNSVPDVLEPSEAEVQIDTATVVVPEGELVTKQHNVPPMENELEMVPEGELVTKQHNVPPMENELEIHRSEPERLEDQGGKADLTENNVDHGINIPVSELESTDSQAMETDLLETGVSDKSIGNDLTEPQPINGDVKGSFSLDTEEKRLPLDNATSVEQSPDFQQRNLPPAEEEKEKQDLIEIEANIDEQGDVDPVAVGGNQKLVESKAAGCEPVQGEITDQFGPEVTAEPVETPDLQSFPNDSEGVMKNPVSNSIGESEESKIDSTSRAEDISETLTVDMLFDTTHKSSVASELEMVDGDIKSEMMAETRQSQEASPEEGVLHDQIAERTGSFDVADKDFSSEDCNTEKALKVEDTTTLSQLKSTDATPVDADQNDLGDGHGRDDVSENEAATALDEPSPGDSNILDVQGVVDDVSSVADNSPSGSADDTCSQTETANSEIDAAVKSNNISDGTLRPNINFGSFGSSSPLSHTDINFQSDSLNKSTAFSTISSKSKLYSANVVTSLNSQANGDHFAGLNHDTACAQVARREQTNEVPVASVELSDAQNINPDFARGPFYWLIKIPRGDERKYREMLRESEIELAEKTKTRNAFQAEFNKHQAYCRELRSNLEAAKLEARAALDLMRAKRREVDSSHSLINLARRAVTVEDVDNQRLNLEHTLQHETHTLREERELVREIRQLNHQRQQLSANPQRQQEVQQALNQRDQIGEQLKVLKEELEALRDNFSQADEQVRAAQKKHDDEFVLLNNLKHQVITANDIRQEAYARAMTLKKQLYNKSVPFYQAKNDLRVAYNYAVAGNKDSLERHCINQVDKIMDMWNKNDEFRKEYIECNMRRMLRKFGTLDGTQLGINEMPPSLGDVSDNRVHISAQINSSTAVLAVQKELPVEAKIIEDKLSEKVEQKKAGPSVKKTEDISKNSLAIVARSIEIEEDKEESKLTKEEEEFARKTEQLKREEEATRLREQRKLEEKAKAEEALERKRRNALKAQARAEFKARKEAEERERRAKKKQKKNGGDVDTTENEIAQPSEPSSESVKEPEVTEKPATVGKRPKKASLHPKQIKTTKPIPPVLRNKGKRGLLSYWPYACIVLLAIGLFYLGSFERIQAIKQHISSLLHR